MLVGIQARLAEFVGVATWIDFVTEFETAGAEHAIGCTTEHTWLSPILVLFRTLICKGYKCAETPLTTFYRSKEVRMRDMLFVDNHKGVALLIANEGSDIKVRMSDSEIFGEVAGVNQDAPEGQNAWC